jgi:hypothetical protein
LTAQVIAAEGEHKASRALKEASDMIKQSPTALQLRYLQVTTMFSMNNLAVADSEQHQRREKLHSDLPAPDRPIPEVL